MGIYHIKTSTVADGTNTDLVRPSDWNSAHLYTLFDGVSLTGNTSGVQAVVSSGTLYLAGGNNITLSQDTNSVTVSQFLPYESSFENISGGALATMTLNISSLSHAVAFFLPTPVSASFIRLPVQMSLNSVAPTPVVATMNASLCMYSTWNAVIYSMGAGANSKSLQSVASGSNGWTIMHSVSASNTTQYSITQAFTANAEGNQIVSNSQYSRSSAGIPLSATIFTNFSGVRGLDIDFNNSLDAGAYWLVFGYSSSSATNSTNVTLFSNCFCKYSNHYGVSQINSAFGVMGSTNLTSGGLLGCGSFSTAGGGTTASLPISAISSSASQVRPYFQMLRSA